MNNMPEDCEGVIHTVSSEPIADQPPMPTGTHDWELSWSRKNAIMRLNLSRCPCCDNNQVWHTKEMVGPIIFKYADKRVGRFIFRGRARLDNNGGHPITYFWRPKDDGEP